METKMEGQTEPKPKRKRLSGAEYRKRRDLKNVLLAMEKEATLSLLNSSLYMNSSAFGQQNGTFPDVSLSMFDCESASHSGSDGKHLPLSTDGPEESANSSGVICSDPTVGDGPAAAVDGSKSNKDSGKKKGSKRPSGAHYRKLRKLRAGLAAKAASTWGLGSNQKSKNCEAIDASNSIREYVCIAGSGEEHESSFAGLIEGGNRAKSLKKSHIKIKLKGVEKIKPKRPSGAEYRKRLKLKNMLQSMEQEAVRSLQDSSVYTSGMEPVEQDETGAGTPQAEGKCITAFSSRSDIEKQSKAAKNKKSMEFGNCISWQEESAIPSGSFLQDADGTLDDPAMWPDLDDDMRCWLVQSAPVQLSLPSYPKDAGGRQFSNCHYSRRLVNGETIWRSWLVYSTSVDAVFCYCCKLYHFAKFALAGQGSKNWKNIGSILKNHEKSADHVTAYFNWKELEARIRTCKVEDRGGLSHQTLNREARHWRDVLERLVLLVRLLCTLNLPLRGSSDQLYLSDNGNFLKCVEFMGDFDPVTKEHARRIDSGEMHDRCLGATFQDEIVNLLASKIKEKIVSKLKSARYYSVIVNRVSDVDRRERTTLTVRFVTICEADLDKPAVVSVEEHFLGFLEPANLTECGLEEALLHELELAEISVSNMRGQSYGRCGDIQSMYDQLKIHLRTLNSSAFLVPCRAHPLIMDVMNAADYCPLAVRYFGLVQDLFNFFVASCDRWNSFVACSNCKLERCETRRWESKLDALQALRFHVAKVYDVLVAMTEDASSVGPVGVRTRVDAGDLALRLLDFGFLCFLVVWHDVLYEFNALNKKFLEDHWHGEVTLGGLTEARTRLRAYRTDHHFDLMLVKSQKLAEELEIYGRFMKGSGHHALLLGATDAPASDDHTFNMEKYFRVNVYDRILDSAVECVDQRFVQLTEQNKIFSFLYDMSALQEMNPQSLLQQCMFLQVALASRDAGVMDVSAVELCDELKLLVRRIGCRATPLEVLEYLCKSRMVGLFPNVYVAMRILLTLPSSAMGRGELVGSKLKRIETFLRSSAASEASAELATIAIENEVAEELDIKDVIEKFAQVKALQCSSA